MRQWVAMAFLAGMLAPGPPGGAEPAMIREQQDRQSIIAHIRSIFEAYIRRDRETIQRTHSSDWVGFSGPSQRIERGIADYMRNADASLDEFRGVGYELTDTEVQIYGDVAVVYYVGRYDYVEGDGPGPVQSLPLRSVDIYQRRSGDWIQIGSHIAPIPRVSRWDQGEKTR